MTIFSGELREPSRSSSPFRCQGPTPGVSTPRCEADVDHATLEHMEVPPQAEVRTASIAAGHAIAACATPEIPKFCTPARRRRPGYALMRKAVSTRSLKHIVVMTDGLENSSTEFTKCKSRR